jgi:hypothetical protein
MKTSLFLGTALGALLFSSIASAATVGYHTDLDPNNENDGPATTSGTGTVDAIFDDATNVLCGTVTFANLSGPPTGGIHIHQTAAGDPTADGDVVHVISAGTTTSPVSFSFTLSAAEATSLAAGELYVNIHTTENGAGEERGNLGTDGVNASYTCPAVATDAGADGGSTSSSSSGSSGASSSSGATSSTSSSGATTERPDSGTSNAAAPKDDSGCNTTGSSDSTNGLAVAFGLGIALMGFARARKNNKS